MSNIMIGQKGEVSFTVTIEKTAKSFESGGLDVFATPAMIAAMESAACKALQLDEGSTSVGTSVNIKHVSATPVGMKIRAEAEVVAVDGRSVEFIVRAYDEAGLIGEGTHGRAVVGIERFMQRVEGKSAR